MLSRAKKTHESPTCNKCRVPYDHRNILYPRDCECSLVIPGEYPISDALNNNNILFLKFVDKLQTLFCFRKPWRSEGQNIRNHTTVADEFVLDNPSNKLNGVALTAWTDGSQDARTKQAGYGVFYENKNHFVSFDFANTSCRLDRTVVSNNIAELSGILSVIETVNHLQFPYDVRILSDSAQSIRAIIKIMQGNECRGNRDLLCQLQCVLQQCNCRIEIHKCKAHSGILGNEAADMYSKVASGLWN